jgi:heat shock protein 4
MEDFDFSSNITRVSFEELCQPLMAKLREVLESAQSECGLPVSAIDSVEMCGGASRVPWVKEVCSKAFGGKSLSTTMNADECVARGCALQAAILSPYYQVRDFTIDDCCRIPIDMSWAVPGASLDDQDSGQHGMTIFPKNSLLHLTKSLSFQRNGPFELQIQYSHDTSLFPGTPQKLGVYRVDLSKRDKPARVKVRVALTAHGTVMVEGANLIEDNPDAPADAAIASPAEDGKDDDNEAKDSLQRTESDGTTLTNVGVKRKRLEGAEEEVAKRRARFRRTELLVSKSGCPGLSGELLNKFIAEEQVMQAEMQEFIEMSARRNDLESYIFSLRGNVSAGAKYADFITEPDREALLAALVKAEDWIYDHEDAGKEVFIKKLADLRAMGNPVELRFQEDAKWSQVCADFEKTLSDIRSVKGEGSPLDAVCEEAEAWLKQVRVQRGSKLVSPPTAEAERRCAEVSTTACQVLGPNWRP